MHCNYRSCRDSHRRRGGGRIAPHELHPAPWPGASATSAELSLIPARLGLGGDIPTPVTPQGCPHGAAFGGPLLGQSKGGGGDLVMGFGALRVSKGWDTSLWDQGHRCTPWGKVVLLKPSPSPPIEPFHGLWCCSSQGMGLTGYPETPSWGWGGESGAAKRVLQIPWDPTAPWSWRGRRRSRSCPDACAGERRGRPEAGVQETVYWRLWQLTSPPLRDGGGCPDPPSAPHLLPSQLQPSKRGGLEPA